MPGAHACKECGRYVELSEALACVNWMYAVEPSRSLVAGAYPPCLSIYHVACYRVSLVTWPTVLTPTAGYKTRGRGARTADATTQLFICECCRVRAQCGFDVQGDVGEWLRELERVRLLCLWSRQADTTVAAVANARRALRRFDAKLPGFCPAAAPPFRRIWPVPDSRVTLAWAQLEMMVDGKGRGEGGIRAVGSLKALRTATSDAHRQRAMLDPRAVESEAKIAIVEGTVPADSIGSTYFIRGLEATLGSKSTQADPLPPSVARALEREFVELQQLASGVWERYEAACAHLALVECYTLFLRGNEPWKQRYSVFREQPFLRAPCPLCGHTHARVVVNERVKTDPRGFDMVLGVPLSGAGLHTLKAVESVISLRGQAERLLQARGLNTDYLFVRRDGKPWDNDYFWRAKAVPLLRRLVAAGHPGTTGLDLSNTARSTIRMLRRGGETFVLGKTGVKADLVDKMARWREKARNKEPTLLRQRYYGGPTLSCEDGYYVTTARAKRTALGFAAWYPFEIYPFRD